LHIVDSLEHKDETESIKTLTLAAEYILKNMRCRQAETIMDQSVKDSPSATSTCGL